MKHFKGDNSFQRRAPSFRKSVQRTIEKLSKLTKFEVPISMTFKEKRKKYVEVRLSTRINGRSLTGVGHGENSFSALKNARKDFFRGYEVVKKNYHQRTLRIVKKDRISLPFTIEEVLTPRDSDIAS